MGWSTSVIWRNSGKSAWGPQTAPPMKLAFDVRHRWNGNYLVIRPTSGVATTRDMGLEATAKNNESSYGSTCPTPAQRPAAMPGGAS